MRGGWLQLPTAYQNYSKENEEQTRRILMDWLNQPEPATKSVDASTANALAGAFMGMVSGDGDGEAELLFPPFPPGSTQSTSDSDTHGFGFFCGSSLTNGECVGVGQFPKAMTFTNSDPLTNVQSEYAASASAVFDIKTWSAPYPGTRTTVGTITFAALGTTGTVAWTSSPTTVSAGTIIELYAPSPNDATLGWVSGIINGVQS